jgi:hypothetical protein
MTTSTLQSKSLFAQGYRVRAGKCPGELAVKSPAGAVYTINPVAKTCTCPGAAFRGPCKHVLGATELVREELADRNGDGHRYSLDVGHAESMFRLMVRWHQILDEQGVEVVQSNKRYAQDMIVYGENMLELVRSLRGWSRPCDCHHVDCDRYQALAGSIESYYCHLAK